MTNPQPNEIQMELPPEAAEAIERARADHLAGKPGELHFTLTVTRKDGTVDQVALVGTVDGAA